MISLVPLGDHAFLARFATEAEARGWAGSVRGLDWDGIAEVVLAYRTVAVHAEPEAGDLDELEARLRDVAPRPNETELGRLISLPVLYDGEDLAEVAARVGRTPAEVVALHAGRDYDVFAIGFLPGFPYAGYLPPELAGLPRRDSPRLRVPAGSVAIVGRQTGVYPRESPGGWHLIGRTPMRIVDLAAGYFPIRAGDRLRFVPVGSDEFAAMAGQLLAGDGAGSRSPAGLP
jgi:KipI family sensor histidine kinase inhibitor